MDNEGGLEKIKKWEGGKGNKAGAEKMTKKNWKALANGNRIITKEPRLDTWKKAPLKRKNKGEPSNRENQ